MYSVWRIQNYPNQILSIINVRIEIFKNPPERNRERWINAYLFLKNALLWNRMTFLQMTDIFVAFSQQNKETSEEEINKEY